MQHLFHCSAGRGTGGKLAAGEREWCLTPALLVTARYNQQIVGEVILLRPDHTYATFTVERFLTGTAPPAAADTVYNLGYWNNTGGALVIGVIDASQSGDTPRISSSERGLSMYARR